MQEGHSVKARVSRVLADGKMDLSLQKKVADQMSDDAAALIIWMQEHGGEIPFTDKAPAAQIRETFGLSRNAFKRAVGRLLKEGRIRIGKETIELI